MIKKYLPILITLLLIIPISPISTATTLTTNEKKQLLTINDDLDITINVAKLEIGYKAFSGKHFKITKLSGDPITINVPKDGSKIKVKYIVKWKQHDSSDKQEMWYFGVTFDGETKDHKDDIDAPLVPDENSGEFVWIREYNGKRAKPLELKFNIELWLWYRNWLVIPEEYKIRNYFGEINVIINYPLYQPKINVEPKTLTWKNVKVNQHPPEKQIKISNVGEKGSLLSWEIIKKPDYLRIFITSGKNLGAGESTSIDVVPDENKLEKNREYTGEIIIDSNGGIETISVKVITDKSKEKIEKPLIKFLSLLQKQHISFKLSKLFFSTLS